MKATKASVQPDPLNSIAPSNLQAALRGFYTPPKPGPVVIGKGDLIGLLRTLPSLSTEDHVDPILVQIDKYHRGTSLSPDDHALIAFVDDAVTQILRQTDLDFKIEAFVRDFAPFLAVIALEQDVKALVAPQPILSMIDRLIRSCIGWSEDLGILGDQFMEKIEVIVRDAVRGRTTLEQCASDLDAFFDKEEPVYETMEQRLCDSQLSVLAGQKAKYYAAQLLNQQMTGKQLPLFIIFMLQGSWYEFLQNVFIGYGLKSKEWTRASKLTESVIGSLQPTADNDRQRSLMASLPESIKAFCAELTFDTTPMETCLADITGEYELIAAGSPSGPCDFDLLEIDASMGEGNRTIERDMLKQIER
ncbi:MAG: DUF1631 family protein, partial [Pseudomonadales bacterium]|nr:DUF1631 family protein [Pseudomonadales bacterium]